MFGEDVTKHGIGPDLLGQLETLIVSDILPNATTALGATVFFWARVAYAVVYIAGIPWVRTAVWGVSLAGILLVGSQLL